jgi:hypothetical protein
MTKEITPRSTKSEILTAYEELIKNVKEQSKQKPQEIKEKEVKKATVQNASENTSEEIVKNIAGLKLNITSELEKLEDKLITEYKRLSGIQEAIKIENTNLEELYQLSVETDSLAAILLAQKEKKRIFDEEMLKKEDDLKTSIALQKINFEEEINEKRNSWEKDKKETENTLKEEKAEITKSRKREEEEYNYQLSIKRQKEQDVYLTKKIAEEKELKEKKAAFEKEIKERELLIKTSEEELKELLKQVELFPKELAEKIKDTENAITKSLTTQYNFEKELYAKEIEGQLNLKDQSINTLDAKIKELENLIKQLSQKTEISEKTVKDIAIKAIESSSKIQVFDQGGTKNTREEKN